MVGTDDVADAAERGRYFHSIATVECIRSCIDDKQTHFTVNGLDIGYDLGMILTIDWDSVYLHDAVTEAETGSLRWRSVVHLADVLSGAVCVQVEPIASKVGPRLEATETNHAVSGRGS